MHTTRLKTSPILFRVVLIFSATIQLAATQEFTTSQTETNPTLLWSAGLSVAGGQRSTSTSETQPAAFVSASGSMSRSYSSGLVLGAANVVGWGEFIETERLMQNSLSGLVQIGSDTTFSIIPQVSVQLLERNLFSLGSDLTFDLRSYSTFIYFGASMAVGLYRSLDPMYEYLTGTTRELRGYAGIETIKGLTLGLALTAGKAAYFGNTTGIEASAGYTITKNWNLSLNTSLTRWMSEEPVSHSKSINAEIGYRLNKELSCYVSQYFERNDSANSWDPLNESRSIVGLTLALGNTNQ